MKKRSAKDKAKKAQLLSVIGLLLSITALAIAIIVNVLLYYSQNTTIVNFITIAIVLIAGVSLLAILGSNSLSKGTLVIDKTNNSLQRDRTMTIINNLADAVLSTDENGVIQVYNAASMVLLDTNVSLSGRRINSVLPLTDQNDKKVDILKELQSTTTVTTRDDLNFIIEKDDKIRLELTYTPISHIYSSSAKTTNNKDGYVIILRDVTKAKTLEEEKDEFISVVSHELRTPITIAEGTISNVQEMMHHPDMTNEMFSDAVKVAHDQIVFLASMVNDLSTLSRAERGVADTAEYIDVKELANKLHTKYADEAKENKLRLDLDMSAKLDGVCTSRLYLEEMLQNFITNAIKYTHKGSVTLIFKQKDKTITFAVKDTGIGISKAEQSKVFDKFYRSEDYRTRETSGTGLGLNVAAKLAEKINTKIIVNSRLNFGSTFSFTLPVAKKEQKS